MAQRPGAIVDIVAGEGPDGLIVASVADLGELRAIFRISTNGRRALIQTINPDLLRSALCDLGNRDLTSVEAQRYFGDTATPSCRRGL